MAHNPIHLFDKKRIGKVISVPVHKLVQNILEKKKSLNFSLKLFI